MAEAILDVTDNGMSIKQSAGKHGIPTMTLYNRMQGTGAQGDQEQPSKRLSKEEEDRLVTWILRQESIGYAPTHPQVKACVSALLKMRGYEQPLGNKWLTRFIARHPEVKTKIGRRQEASRFNGFTPKAVNWYFNIRENEFGWIKPENTVNVDKGGIMAGFGRLSSLCMQLYVSDNRFLGLDGLVIGSSDPKKRAMLKSSQSRAWTSFIEACTADGRILRPGIIFKGKELQAQWFIDEFRKIADWYFITSPNGWTDNHIAVDWLESVYFPQTEPEDLSEARLIILDGHGSHATVRTSRYLDPECILTRTG